MTKTDRRILFSLFRRSVSRLIRKHDWSQLSRQQKQTNITRLINFFLLWDLIERGIVQRIGRRKNVNSTNFPTGIFLNKILSTADIGLCFLAFNTRYLILHWVYQPLDCLKYSSLECFYHFSSPNVAKQINFSYYQIIIL